MKLCERKEKRNGTMRIALHGSYTVEAALIVSMLLFLLAALILCSFAVHDRVVLQCISCETSVAGTNFCLEKERIAEAQKVREGFTAGRLLGSQGLAGEVRVDKKQCNSSWKARYPIPGFAISWFMQDSLDISVSWKSRWIDPADMIRKVRGAQKTLQSVTGGTS